MKVQCADSEWVIDRYSLKKSMCLSTELSFAPDMGHKFQVAKEVKRPKGEMSPEENILIIIAGLLAGLLTLLVFMYGGRYVLRSRYADKMAEEEREKDAKKMRKKSIFVLAFLTYNVISECHG